MAKVQKYLSCYGITVECDVPDPVPSTNVLINENEGEREVLSNEVEEDIATAEESTFLVENLAEQADENQELLENPNAVITEEVVQEANNNFLLTLGRLGNGTDYLKSISLGQESYRTPRTNLQVTQEGIVESIKNFFKKIWEWIKGVFAKIGKLFGFKQKQTEAAENAMANASANPEEIAKVAENTEDLPKDTVICAMIMGHLQSQISAFAKRTPADPAGPLKSHFTTILGLLQGEDKVVANDFINLSAFRKMDGQSTEKTVANAFGIKLENDDRLLSITDRGATILTRDNDNNTIIRTIPIDEALNEIENILPQKLSQIKNYNTCSKIFKDWQDMSKQHLFSNQQEKLKQQEEKFLRMYETEVKAIENAANKSEKPQGVMQAKLNIVNIYLKAYTAIFEQLWFLAKSGVKILTPTADTVDDTVDEDKPKKSKSNKRRKL